MSTKIRDGPTEEMRKYIIEYVPQQIDMIYGQYTTMSLSQLDTHVIQMKMEGSKIIVPSNIKFKI